MRPQNSAPGWLTKGRLCAAWALLLLCTVSALAQTRITGRVVDDQQAALPGVSVVIKGTTIGSVTDASGNYSVNAPDKAGSLIFSYIGFVSQEVPINNRSSISITLAADTKALNEVVVVGYGVQKKETVTGSVASVKGSELVKSPAVNLSNSIAGRLPGVFAVNRSGEPGADGSSIRIRGSNTLNNTAALIVIDGIPGREGGLDRNQSGRHRKYLGIERCGGGHLRITGGQRGYPDYNQAGNDGQTTAFLHLQPGFFSANGNSQADQCRSVHQHAE
jgi:hypothetical protein